jgi:hypothetical protein
VAHRLQAVHGAACGPLEQVRALLDATPVP